VQLNRYHPFLSLPADQVWPADATQAEVFADIEPTVLSVCDGFNTCLFAYGQVHWVGHTHTHTPLPFAASSFI